MVMWLGFVNLAIFYQRAFQKGRVTKVPLGKMPLIDTPF